ncbi:ras-related protein Rab-34-like, partial [Littorina saxatilis]|uniref:ras-related protein Rab-34-like n=1 Tax=Littorina saxatilis TaxID=31220 RepID=UPI0038B6AC35
MQRQKMSSGRTVLAAVPKDRVITQYPKPYNPNASPYNNIEFHPKVKGACAENRTGRVGLKICKAVIVGDVAVGKTCVVNRFCHNVFNRDYKATIGVDFEVEKFSVLGVPFTLQMWDTAGQERFKCIASSYYRGANSKLMCQSVCQRL